MFHLCHIVRTKSGGSVNSHVSYYQYFEDDLTKPCKGFLQDSALTWYFRFFLCSSVLAWVFLDFLVHVCIQFVETSVSRLDTWTSKRLRYFLCDDRTTECYPPPAALTRIFLYSGV